MNRSRFVAAREHFTRRAGKTIGLAAAVAAAAFEQARGRPEDTLLRALQLLRLKEANEDEKQEEVAGEMVYVDEGEPKAEGGNEASLRGEGGSDPNGSSGVVVTPAASTALSRGAGSSVAPCVALVCRRDDTSGGKSTAPAPVAAAAPVVVALAVVVIAGWRRRRWGRRGGGGRGGGGYFPRLSSDPWEGRG